MSEALFGLFPTLDIQQSVRTQPRSSSTEKTSLACQVPLGHYGAKGPTPFATTYTLFSGEGIFEETCASPGQASMTLRVESWPQDPVRAVEFAALSVGILILNKNAPPSGLHPLYLRGKKEDELRLLQSVCQWFFAHHDPAAVSVRYTGHANGFFRRAMSSKTLSVEFEPFMSQVQAALPLPGPVALSPRLG